MKKKEKKIILIIILLIIGVLIIAGGIFGFRIYQLSEVTRGKKISTELVSKNALVVLDVQNATLGIKEYGNSDLLMENINSAIRYAKDNNIDIIYTKQEFSNPIDKLVFGGLYEKDSEGSALSGQLEVLSSNVFTKEKTDEFSNREFDEYLAKEKITRLLYGWSRCFCLCL